LRFVRRYLVPRLIQYVLVICLGITVVFFIPRLMPTDPVERVISALEAQGGYLDPAALEETILTLRETYGLEEGLFKQYISFWGRLFTLDFGPSLFMFPVPVFDLIRTALPWTAGLLFVSLLLGWTIGNILGGLTGYFRQSRILKIFDGMVMLVRPIPYYIMALLLIIFFAYLLPIFPIGGGYTVGYKIAFTWRFVGSVLKHAFLPLLSLTLLNAAFRHQTMRLLVQTVRDEDFIHYAKIGNVKERTIFSRYVLRNAILPQITGLAMSLGMIFGGALITEIVFSYPGIGHLLYRAIVNGDFNLIMGITTISIVAIATGILVIDFLYPLFDPRIRLK